MSNSKMRVMTFKEIREDKTLKPPEIIGDGILPHEALLVIIGAPKTRKSFLVYNLATAIAEGRGFACFKIEESYRVLILSAEGGYFSNRDRIKVITEQIDDEAAERAKIATFCNIKVDGEYEEIKKLIEEHTPKVLIIDPLIRFHSQDENTAQGMSIVFDKLRQLIEEHHISIILVHHSGKNMRKGGRGSSVIEGEYDSAITISKTKLKFDLRHAESPSDININFNDETLWIEGGGNVEQINCEDNVMYRAVNFVRKNGASKKSSIRDAIMKEYSCSDKTAYRNIADAIKNGILEETDDNLIQIKE